MSIALPDFDNAGYRDLRRDLQAGAVEAVKK